MARAEVYLPDDVDELQSSYKLVDDEQKGTVLTGSGSQRHYVAQ
jgi:hypothetical protein